MSAYVRHVKRLDTAVGSNVDMLFIELTERCNNDCLHCCINRPENDGQAQAREMTAGQIVRILDEAADLGCLQVCFTGGEPLLRPDFEELYLAARRKGLRVLLMTNARLITPELAGLFARVPPLESVEISVYGMSAASYEAVSRAPGSFAQFRNGIELLRRQRVPFIVKFAVLPQNKHEIEAFEPWAQSLPGASAPPAYVLNFSLRHRRDSPARNRLIRSLRLSPGEQIDILLRRDESFRKQAEAFRARFMGAAVPACGAGRSPCIDAYGRVQPCLSLRDPERTVNVFGADAPAGASLRNAMAAFSKESYVARNPQCGPCFLRGFCDQCQATSWIEHGKPDQPVPYHCDMAHEQARRLGWTTDEP